MPAESMTSLYAAAGILRAGYVASRQPIAVAISKVCENEPEQRPGKNVREMAARDTYGAGRRR